MKNGEMKTLREWIKNLKIVPVKYTFESTGNTIDTYKSEVKKDRNGYIDIYTKGGYGLSHKDIERYLDEIFFTRCQADTKILVSKSRGRRLNRPL